VQCQSGNIVKVVKVIRGTGANRLRWIWPIVCYEEWGAPILKEETIVKKPNRVVGIQGRRFSPIVHSAFQSWAGIVDSACGSQSFSTACLVRGSTQRKRRICLRCQSSPPPLDRRTGTGTSSPADSLPTARNTTQRRTAHRRPRQTRLQSWLWTCSIVSVSGCSTKPRSDLRRVFADLARERSGSGSTT